VGERGRLRVSVVAVAILVCDPSLLTAGLLRGLRYHASASRSTLI
jgi:hypothetical protein